MTGRRRRRTIARVAAGLVYAAALVSLTSPAWRRSDAGAAPPVVERPIAATRALPIGALPTRAILPERVPGTSGGVSPAASPSKATGTSGTGASAGSTGAASGPQSRGPTPTKPRKTFFQG